VSDVRPFSALLPAREMVGEVLELPYDVVSRQEARRLAQGRPYSFFHITKPEIEFPETSASGGAKVHQRGAENLHRFIAQGIFQRESEPGFYVYRLASGEHQQSGLVCAVSLSEYRRGLIRRHELTREDKEEERFQHLRALDANDEPVLLAYRRHKDIESLLGEIENNPEEYDLSLPDGVRHTIWKVPAARRSAIQEAFLKVPALYLADGHHRMAAACRLAEERLLARGDKDEPGQYCLAVLFPHHQLQILGYHRVVRDLGGLSPSQFLAKIERNFELEETGSGKPQQPHSFAMYFQGRWYRLKARSHLVLSGDIIRSLDVAILQENLLEPILGISQPRTDPRIEFVGGVHGLELMQKLVDVGWAVGFSLHPTSLDQVLAAADAGLVLPPKSTWFEPKLRSGFFLRQLCTW
jgi:uncharacterized protein (DUF1015 family)